MDYERFVLTLLDSTALIGVNLTLTGRFQPQLHKLAPAYAGLVKP